MSHVQLLVGPARSGKTAALVEDYRARLASGPPGGALWLAPTHRHVRQLRGVLTGGTLKACFQPQCYTFSQLAGQILAVSRLPVRPLNKLGQRELLRALVDEALRKGRLRYFEPIAHTAGFLDLLVRLIRELKRLEIWPEAFSQASSAGRPTKRRPTGPDKHSELAALYAQYQAVLEHHHLYDAEGRFWSARFLLRQGQTQPLDKLRHVFVDGFTDFTRTEHEILEILAQRVDRLTFTLPLDPEPGREELFDKVRRTRTELARRHLGLEVIERPRAAAAWPALGHLEANIFRSPRSVPAPPPLSRVELLTAAGQQAELEAIATRIKRLLVLGDDESGGTPVRPSQIVVALRSLAGCEELVGEVFGEFGIPLALEGARPLGRSGPLAAITSLVELERADWPYRQLLHVLSLNFFRPDWPDCGETARAQAVQCVRALQVPAGKQAVLARLDSAGPRLRDLRGGAALLRRLAQTLERLPKRATAGQWSQALESLAADVRLLADPTADQGATADPSAGDHVAAGEAQPARDLAAWDAALAALHSGDQLSAWLDAAPRQLDREEFWQRWQDILTCEALPEGHDETGRVRVLSAPSVRGLQVDYLFLAGLSEHSFPLGASERGLLSEAEVTELRAQGLPLPTRSERSRDEMLLFYEVLTRPSRRLTLSYAALDASAQPLAPSPYLFELQEICGGALPAALPGPKQLSPLPAGDEPLSLRDLRLMAVARGRDGEGSYLGELLRRQRGLAGSAADNVAAGLIVADQRQRDVFGPYEGLLLGAAVRRALVERFGAERCWTASELEDYAGCPYRFFLARVLGLKPLEELGLSVDYLARGSLLHNTLAALHRRLNDRHGEAASLAELDAEQLREEVLEILAASGAGTASGSGLQQAFAQIDRALLLEMLPDYLDQHQDYERKLTKALASPRPAYFEVEFGPSRKASADEPEPLPTDPLSTRNPFRLSLGGQTVLLSGRIDRIDVFEAGGKLLFNIIDYKSGSARHYSKSAVQEGRVLQLPLYALAAAELLLAGRTAAPWQAGYWFLKGSGFQGDVRCHDLSNGQLQPTEDWQTLRQQVVASVFGTVGGIRAGHFPVESADDKCTSRCEFKTVCRVNQIRSLDKVWQAPVEEPQK